MVKLKLSPETRAKMSESQRKRRAEKQLGING